MTPEEPAKADPARIDADSTGFLAPTAGGLAAGLLGGASLLVALAVTFAFADYRTR